MSCIASGYLRAVFSFVRRARVSFCAPGGFEQGAKPLETSDEKMVKAVDMLARQTVAGLGGTAMKTCLAYIKNALLKPEVRFVSPCGTQGRGHASRRRGAW